ncbi:unnamed protein product [Absidia cylindrospora]
MKQNHGLYRSWLKRYFVLQGRELSYYRNETDKEPQNVLDLDHYTISFKKQSRRHCTFVLVAEEHHMQPDYYLQAETKEDLDIWVTHLQQHMSTSSVLDKWLERLDMNSVPSSHRETTANSCTSSLHAPYQQQQQHQQQQQQQQYYPLRSHHSVESIHTYCSLPSLSHHRVSFTNDRRPSSQSTHSNSSTTSNTSHGTSHTSPPQYRPVTPNNNASSTTTPSLSSSSSSSATKSFTSRLFSSRRQPPHPFHKQRSLDFCITSSSSPSTPSLSTSTARKDHDGSDGSLLDQVGMKLLHHHLGDTSPSMLDDTTASTLTTSIIHPSEYNHDDDPQERLRLRQLQQMDTYSS